LEGLVPAWQKLWREAPSTIFQSPDWLVPFTRYFAPDAFRVLDLRDDTELVSVAPLFFCEDGAGLRKLLLLGAGVSDYLDVVAQPGVEAAMVLGVQQFLAETSAEWDRCELTQLPPHSRLVDLGLQCAGMPCPELDLTGKTNLDFAPARQLEKLRYYRRRAVKEGQLKFVRATRSTCDAMMSELFTLHSARWNALGGDGLLAGARMQQFHHEVARRMAATGCLRLYAATLNDETIAVFYGFASHRRTHYYLGGFAPKFEKLSPGMLIVGHAIEEAIREGQQAFDFLRGQEAYKCAWGAQDRATSNVTVAHT
jgi:CelD/BcsL family acetyltransferase involved in cellulose biosynthesis